MGVSTSSSTVDVLAALCRRELAAVESYRQALNSPNLREHSDVLATCLRSHEQRAEFLKSRIRHLHAEPPGSAGVLGTFARVLEGAAAALSARVAIATLEEEEDRGLRNYRAHLVDVDPESQLLIQEHVLPAQFETHRMMSDLKRARHDAAQHVA